jgi:hypothetical protein
MGRQSKARGLNLLWLFRSFVVHSKKAKKAAMRPALVMLLALVAAGLSGPAAAQMMMPRPPGAEPLDRILPQVRRVVPGQFFDADGPVLGSDGLPHYHLKWMTPDGHIEWLDTDARTGQVLRIFPGRDAFDAPGARRYFAPAPSYLVPPRLGPGPRRFGGRGFGGFARGGRRGR